jgi:dTDP-4-dehydrorhamnose 3,5-epimerase
MKIIKTDFKDLLIIKPTIYKDDRGHFHESFKKNILDEALGGFSNDFVQENESYSFYKVFRGFHFQKPPFEQSKLVKVSIGSVVDIVIDLRKGKTFKQIFQIELSAENKTQLYVPRGFAHGFVVTSKEGAVFQYKCDNYYNKESESGISPYNVDINWPFNIDKDLIIHQRDKDHLKIYQF